MREPNGDWHFFSTNPPEESCAGYMLPELADQTMISLHWSDEHTLQVEVPAISLRWVVSFEETRRTKALSRVAGRLPGWFTRSRPGASVIGFVASATLGAGKLQLSGTVPNGQRFVAQPRSVWNIESSFASIQGYPFGAVIEAPEQYRFGDFLIPRRGLAMAGRAAFDPVPERDAGFRGVSTAA